MDQKLKDIWKPPALKHIEESMDAYFSKGTANKRATGKGDNIVRETKKQKAARLKRELTQKAKNFIKKKAKKKKPGTGNHPTNR